MLKGINASELAKKAGRSKGTEFAKNGAKNAVGRTSVDKAIQKGVDTAAEKAIGAAFAFATGGAAAGIKRKRDKRRERRDAVDLARQVGGTFSPNVIIGSARHHVVWLEDKTPYRVIPELPESAGPLEELPDIKHFCGVRREPKRRRL